MINNEYYYIHKDEFINSKKIELKYSPDKINLSRKKVDEMADLYLRCLEVREIKKSIDINNIYSSILEQIEKAVIKGKDSVLITISDTWDRNTLEGIQSSLKRDGFTVTYDFFNTACLRVYGWA